MLVDVVQVVAPLPEKGRIGVACGCGFFCFGVRQVIGQPGGGRALRHRRCVYDRLRLPSTARGGDEGKEEGCQNFLGYVHCAFPFNSVSDLG